MYNKSLPISLLKKIIFLIVTTYYFFNFVTIYTASLEGYIDGCDTYGYPLTYKSNCELNNFFSLQNLLLDISFVIIFSILLLLGLLFLLKLKKSLKNKISVLFITTAIVIFVLLIIYIKLYTYFQILSVYYFYFFIFYLIGIAHVLKPIKIKTYLFLFFGMIGYCFFIYFLRNKL